MNLILLAVAWMLGIIAADLAGAPPGLAWPLVGAGIALALLGIATRRGPWRPIAVAALVLGVALLGAARLGGAQLQPSPVHVSRLADRPRVTLHGWVSADPRRAEEGQQVVLAVEAVQAGERTRAAEGLVLASLPTYPEYRYGQRLLLSGELREPRGPRRPGEFDYRAYLRRRSILVTMPEPLARPLEGQRGNPALVALLAFRDRCRAVLIRELPEPQASIAVGVLLGLQSSIPDDIYATFSITGTSHILVVSGWNETMAQSKAAAHQALTLCYLADSSV